MSMFGRAGEHGSQYNQKYTKEQNEQFTQEFSAITEQFISAMKAGKSAQDKQVQDAVASHHAFVSKFWTPNRAAYKSLAMSYILPSEYRDSYESAAEGLGKFIYDAVVIWADQNLD